MFRTSSARVIAMSLVLLVSMSAHAQEPPKYNGTTATQNAQRHEEDNAALSSVLVRVGAWIDRNRDDVNAAATVTVALFTIILAGSTIGLWVATARTAKATEDAIIADKRAFIFCRGVKALYNLDQTDGKYHWQLQPVWHNGGETPTTKIHLYSACEIRNTPLPPGFDFNHAAFLPGIGSLIGPKMEKMGGAVPIGTISPQDILDAQAGKKFIYMWGWVKYFDIFPDTPERMTRFCWKMMPQGDPLTFDPSKDKDSIKFPSYDHTEGNCVDNDCEC